MADPAQPTTINGIPMPSQHTQRVFVTVMALFCWSLIVYIVGWGDPHNSLHTSALAWAFGTSTAVVFAYVFGSSVDTWNLMKAATSLGGTRSEVK